MRILMFATLLAVTIPVAAFAGSTKTSLHAAMTGAAERPKGDANGRGTAEIVVVNRKVCWELSVRNIGKPQAAHIHKGRAGVSGPVVVPLGSTYRNKGCTTTTAANASAIAARPRTFYVNVHNAAYPNGAVRGQLHR